MGKRFSRGSAPEDAADAMDRSISDIHKREAADSEERAKNHPANHPDWSAYKKAGPPDPLPGHPDWSPYKKPDPGDKAVHTTRRPASRR